MSNCENCVQKKYDCVGYGKVPCCGAYVPIDNETTEREAAEIIIKGIEEGTKAVDEAMEKQTPKKPIEKHYEEVGEKPYIKYACPNGCSVQLYPVTKKNLAYEHMYCPKCGQKIDWSETND